MMHFVDLIWFLKAENNSAVQLQQQCRQLHLQGNVGQSLGAPDHQTCCAMINTLLPHNSLLRAQWLLHKCGEQSACMLSAPLE